MKSAVALVFVVLASATVTVQGTNIFEKIFQTLHQGPPPPVVTSRAVLETKYIEQKLDNFDENETRTWQMRYKANSQYFQAGGPIFIFVGGEWGISYANLLGGHLHDMAKEHNGYLFYTEHRFYGKSKPTDDLSTDSLKYLDIKQALADLANFIVKIKEQTEGLENSKVILAGGSYAGTMVAWFMKLYPELIVGAWSSSAPLLAKVDFVEYKEVTGQSIKLVGGEACYNRIQNGIAELEYMIANKRSAEVMSMLKICDTFNPSNDLDVWSLFSSISSSFAGVVQYHSGNSIQKMCQEVLEGETDVIGVSKYFVSYSGISNGCNEISYKDFLKFYANTEYTSNPYRQWFYQTCNEYGWYQTSGSRNQPFGTQFPVTLEIANCNDVYGDQFYNFSIHANADNTNAYFGGKDIEVENVYFTHGQLDPWSAMGITDEGKATVVPLSAHCMDFGSISSSDSAEMRASKEKIAELVREWLKDDTKVKIQRKFPRQLVKV